MRLRIVVSVLLCLSSAAAGAIAQDQSDPITGVWFGDYGTNLRDRIQVRLTFKWDGKTLSGDVTTGDQPFELKNTMFDPKSGALHIEITVTGANATVTRYIVDGKLDKDTITGTWRNETSKGDFNVKKIR